MKVVLVFVLLQHAKFSLGKGPFRTNCQNGGNFNETDVEYSIDSGLLDIHKVNSSLHCAFECIANSHCLSYNYQHESSTSLHDCELLAKSKSDALLTARTGYTHYETGPMTCVGLSCENGGSCVIDCATGVAACFCTAGFDGANCSIGVLPEVEIQPVGKGMLEHGTAVLDCYSSRAETYKWVKDGSYLDTVSTNRINILQNGSLEIRQFTDTDNGDYWCMVINPSGQANSTSVFAGLAPLPSVNFLYTYFKVCREFYNSINFQLSKFTTVELFKDNVKVDVTTLPGMNLHLLPDTSEGRLIFSRAEKSYAGVYHLRASNVRGSVESGNQLTVEVVYLCPALPYPTNGIRRGPRLEGDTISFYCNFKFTLSGSETLNCQTDGTWSGVAPTCSPDTSGNHPVRLVDGGSDNHGRVEIYSGGKWGSVEDTNWDMNDATVVCKELGFPSALDISRHLPSDHVRVFLTNVQCTGSEAKLADCTADYDTKYSSSMKTAGVVCQNVRLVGGGDHYGRLEVYTGGRWGTACDDLWDIMDAEVVCRQLGFMQADSTGNDQGPGTGDIVIDDVKCSGREKTVTHCVHLTQDNCGHAEDVSVKCKNLRLVDSKRYYEGRVEVHYNGEWNTACDDQWDTNEAKVVCNILGFPGYVKPVSSAFFGQGTGTVLIDDAQCTGNEDDLLSCPRVATPNCGHGEDAGVICQAHVRLAGSSRYNEGRVEVYKDGSWGTVCDSKWDFRDGHVVCRMLGYDGAVETYDGAHFGQGTGTIHYDGLQCDGTETRIWHCPKTPSGSCTHGNDAGVRCRVVRLFNGVHKNEGRVLFFRDSSWGRVCDTNLTSTDARRICSEVSRSAITARWNVPISFGTGGAVFKLRNMACTGTEKTIMDCPHSTTDASACTSSNVVSVRCNSGVRIYHSNSIFNRGIVGVFRDRGWTRVCANEWDIRDAHVMCRELRYAGAIRATAEPRTGPYTVQKPNPMNNYWVSRGGYRCEGYEGNLEDCDQESVGDTCTHDAAVECQNLRLYAGTSAHIGRLEIFLSGAWGGFCDKDWDIRDAHVACIQLGYPSGAATTYSAGAAQARSSGTRWITKVYCGGLETSILDCGYTRDTNSCLHTEEVWVECIP